MTKTVENSVIAQCDVVVVNYNGGEFLRRCVESVFSADVPIRLMVVDNASRDDSLASIQSLDTGDHQLDIVRNDQNLGFATAVNIGAKRGNADYVLLLNPDCEIHPHTVRKLLAEATQYSDLGVLGALVFNEDGTEQRGCRRLEPTFVRSMVTALRLGKRFQSVNLQHEPLPEAPQSIDAVSGSAMLIERQAFNALGGMDEAYFLHVEDLDFCRRMREFGKKIYFTPNVSIFHHHGAASHGVPYKTEWHKHQGMLRYQKKFQKPNQNWLRSILTRGVIYLNFVLSILRKFVFQWRQQDDPGSQALICKQSPLLISGATSDLGQAVLQGLARSDLAMPVIAVSRADRYPATVGQERWFCWSFFDKVPADDFPAVDTWLAVSPIWSAAEMGRTLSRFGRLRRAIALSSTSIVGKAATEDSKEQAVVSNLASGEQSLQDWAQRENSALTICRASMIYGGEHNQNIAFIQRMIKWFRFFPMLSEGQGLRQPVHIDDLSIALRGLIARDKLPQTTYILAGCEQLSYRSMIERIFVAQNQKPRLVVIPRGLFMRVASVLSYVPGFGFLNADMITRMERNLIYDIEPARRDFAYAPGMFRPGKNNK